MTPGPGVGSLSPATVYTFGTSGSAPSLQGGNDCGIPPDGSVVAIGANVFMLNPSATGSLRAWKAGAAKPNAAIGVFDRSSLGEVSFAGTFADIQVDANGQFDLWSDNGSTDIVVDVSGYWTNLPAVSGPTGATGPAGVAGPTGATGSPGPVGATGSTGAQGIQGVTGITGATGSTGATGAQGSTGATGAQGIQGVTGAGFANGSSAGQVYLTGSSPFAPQNPQTVSGDVTFSAAAVTTISNNATTGNDIVSALGLATNTIPAARLGSSSGNSNTYLNGTGTFAAPFTLTTTGTSGAATFSSGTLNIPTLSSATVYSTINTNTIAVAGGHTL